MKPRFDVTVIVPTYQGARYLDETLDSIAAQDLTGVEVLVNDDASTDDTVAIARSHLDAIDNLRVEVNPQRLGAVGNVNRCLELARSQWIKPVFQDDLIDPGCLAAMRAARRRGVPVVVAGRRYRFEDDTPDWQRNACDHLLGQSLCGRFGSGHLSGPQVAEVAAEHAGARRPQLNFVGEPVSILLDRRAARRAGSFDVGYVQLWDYELVARLAVRRGVVLIDEPLATFRVHGRSETARNLSGSTFEINVLDRLRLLVAYATGPSYGPVRLGAVRHVPPVDLTAHAIGVSNAAHRLAEELPETERAPAAAKLNELTRGLPVPAAPETPGADEARNAEIALLMELSERDLPQSLVTEAAPPDQPPGEAGPPGQNEAPRPALTPTRIIRALRANEWWGHMLGPIMAFACLSLGWRSVPPGEGLLRVAALVFSAIALVAYGYVVNDAADVAADGLAGKANSLAKLPRAARVGVIAGFALLGALPWLVIRLDPPALVALGCIYLVPILYSVRPIRLKERHLLGPLADASNAFALPALFTIALFAPLGQPTGPNVLLVVGAVLWSLGFGLRAIIKHQVDDAGHDRATGTTTLVVGVGEARANQVTRAVLFPMELVGLTVLIVTVATWSWGTVAVGVGYAALFHGLRVTGVIDRGLATTTLEQGWWLSWYRTWPALLLSLGLAVSDPWYLILVAFVVGVFWPQVRNGLQVFSVNAGREFHLFRQRRRARSST